MTVGSLFAGIGGFELAAQWAGLTPVWSNEIDPFCCKVLRKNFKHRIIEEDIRNIGAQNLEPVDILTGGFPCQTFSLAGKGAMDLSLWKEMFRVIQEIKPKIVVAENVLGLLVRKKGVALETVCVDLESQGYTVLPPLIIPACGKGAPHRRNRVWIIAYSGLYGHEWRRLNEGGRQASQSEIQENKWQWVRYESGRVAEQGVIADPHTQGLQKRIQPGKYCFQKPSESFKGSEFTRTYPKSDWSKFPTQSPVSTRDDGVSGGLVRYTGKRFSRLRKESIKGGGNAISPQVAFEIFKAIKATL